MTREIMRHHLGPAAGYRNLLSDRLLLFNDGERHVLGPYECAWVVAERASVPDPDTA